MDILNFLTQPYQNYTISQIALEIIAASTGILSVFLIGKRNIKGYPTGILSTTLYTWLLWHWGLMGDMLINIYYTAMSIYGWISWQGKTQPDQTVQIRRMTHKEYMMSLFIFLISYAFTISVYKFKPIIAQIGQDITTVSKLHHLVVPDFIDAFTTALFLIAMWLMARRNIEHWAFWIAGNLISIPLYIWKGYSITALQYLIFLILSYYGWRQWVKTLKSNY